MKDVLTFVMAGGKGERLRPLTLDRSKPRVPFGGIYRLIDFTLSNCVNSGAYKIVVLPQYKSQSLNEHLERGWNILSEKIGHFLKIVPPQQRTGSDWYKGTADCIRQNSYLIERYKPQHVLVLSGDHIYKNNVIPQGTEIGFNPDQDRERFTVTPRGIVVIPKGYFKYEN